MTRLTPQKIVPMIAAQRFRDRAKPDNMRAQPLTRLRDDELEVSW
jgi:hypothetical protein